MYKSCDAMLSVGMLQYVGDLSENFNAKSLRDASVCFIRTSSLNLITVTEFSYLFN